MTDVQARIAALSREQRALLESRVAGLAAGRVLLEQPIRPRDTDRPAPLSFAQQREWALERYRPSNNIPSAIRLEGKLDFELFGRSLTEVLARHEALRTTVEMQGKTPVQVVNPVTPVPVPVVDFAGLDVDERSRQVREFCDAEVIRPFPLDEPQRMRVTLLRLAPDVHVAVVTTHHASSDGWSMSIIAKETVAAYRALRDGAETVNLPPPPIQYADFAIWQREQLGDEWMAEELAYWKTTLDDIPPRLALPKDRPYPARRTFAGTYHVQSVPRETSIALERFGENAGLSTSMLMLTACSVLLHRYTGQDDLVFGSPISGRTRTETEQVVGCFANALPLRMRMSRDQTLREVLHQARDVSSAAFDHQNLPFDVLIEELARDETSQTPLIQMMINVPTSPKSITWSTQHALEMPGLRVRQEPIDPGPIPIDLILIVQALPEELSIVWHYSTELFDAETIGRLADHLRDVLQQIVADPDLRVGDVRLGDNLAPQANGTRAEVSDVRRRDEATSFVGLFRRQVALTPDAPAVVRDGEETSFGELHRKAVVVANRLRGLGVTTDTPVGLLLDRSLRLPVAIIGVLEAGGAFLPLGSDYPADRVAFVLADAGAPVLLTTPELAPLAADAEGTQVVLLDELLDVDPGAGAPSDALAAPGPGSAAYVIYTSGSTGTPKGVVVEHRSLARFARDVADRLELDAGDRFLQFASPGFDVLIEELFPIWLAGGTIVLPPSRKPSAMGAAGLDLAELAERERISVVELPAAYWHEWVRELDRTGRDLPGSLRLVIVGAERVLPERLSMWTRFDVPLMHVYGITETTVSSTFYRLGANAPAADLQHLPIGTALPSVDLRVLDSDLRPVPTGGVGELYIGGVSVARGYLGRAAETAQRFIADPEAAWAGGRLYRCGDLVRRRADGNLEFLSRADDQIKIRGYRIEPAEIESALCRHPQVAQAVVAVHRLEAGDDRLVAYLVPQPRTRPNITDVRRFLARELPPYLVPAAYMQLETLPLSDNGKVDHGRLPAPGVERPDVEEELVLPSTPLEQQLADIVASVLGVTLVGANDNFFELGGDSILAIQVVARAQEMGIALQPLDLFEHPTVTLLAATAIAAAAEAEGSGDTGSKEESVSGSDNEPAASDPTDFPLARVDQGELDILLGRINVGKRN